MQHANTAASCEITAAVVAILQGIGRDVGLGEVGRSVCQLDQQQNTAWVGRISSIQSRLAPMTTHYPTWLETLRGLVLIPS